MSREAGENYIEYEDYLGYEENIGNEEYLGYDNNLEFEDYDYAGKHNPNCMYYSKFIQ